MSKKRKILCILGIVFIIIVFEGILRQANKVQESHVIPNLNLLNAPTPTPNPPFEPHVPTFTITDVVADSTVTIQTKNFPPGEDFNVRMNFYGTLGIGGTIVDTINSEEGGTLTATFLIPDALHGQYRVAILLESSASGYYAYNWFYNNHTSSNPELLPTLPLCEEGGGQNPVPLPKMTAVYEYPKKVKINQQEPMRILMYPDERPQKNVSEAENLNSIIVAPMNIIGTNDCILEKNSFSDYDICIKAKYVTSDENLKIVGDMDCLPIDEPNKVWNWKIDAKETGVQSVTIEVELYWKPHGSESEMKKRFWFTKNIDITARKSFIDLGTLNIASLISGLIVSWEC